MSALTTVIDEDNNLASVTLGLFTVEVIVKLLLTSTVFDNSICIEREREREREGEREREREINRLTVLICVPE